MSAPRDDDPSDLRGPGADEAAGRRVEPRLGWLDGLSFGDPYRKYRTSEEPTSRMPSVRWWVLGSLIVLVSGVVLFRNPLADRLWPETRAQVLRERAIAALAMGRLTAADGTGARELYEAALALDPDRDEARRGLMVVADAALEQAREAIAENRYADAHRALQLARSLSAPRANTDAVAALLRRHEAEHAGIDDMLARAAAARKTGELDTGADGALPLYQRVLALQPARTEALEGREDSLAELLQRAKANIGQDRLAETALIVKKVREYDAGHVDLPEIQAQLARAIERKRQRADRDLRGGRLEAALSGYRTLLEIDAADAAAAAGIERVGEAYAERAEKRASDFRFAEAAADLDAARAVLPGSNVVREAARHVERTRKARSRLAPAMSTGARNRRVSELIAESDRAAARGDWLTPPGDSAYDKLRAAQALAPADPLVRRAAAQALPTVRRCYEDELRGNRLRRAQACMEAWQQLAPNDRTVRDARTRLAQRWIAVGNERLGAGEVAFGVQALAEARALDPRAPGMDEFATRVKQASAGR